MNRLRQVNNVQVGVGEVVLAVGVEVGVEVEVGEGVEVE